MSDGAEAKRAITEYTYDGNGLVKRQTDARNKWSEAEYDALHRITKRTYGDGTPTVNYAYYTSGEGPQAGRLKSVSSAAGTTAYIYDKMGNVAVSSHAIAGYTQTMNFGAKFSPIISYDSEGWNGFPIGVGPGTGMSTSIPTTKIISLQEIWNK